MARSHEATAGRDGVQSLGVPVICVWCRRPLWPVHKSPSPTGAKNCALAVILTLG